MGCSQPKEFRTGLRMFGSFLKVKLYYNMCGTQVPLPSTDRRGLKKSMKKSSRVRKDLEFGILVESYVDSRSQNVCSFFNFCNSSRHVNGDACGILRYADFFKDIYF